MVFVDAGVLENDLNPDDAPLTGILVNTTSLGLLTFREDGSFVYKPPNGYVGIDTFSYRIYDGYVLSEPATVTISIGIGNTAPEAAADTYDMLSDKILTVDAANGLLANDHDDDGDILTVQLIGGTAFGSLTLNADGSFVYTPNHNYIGDDHFTYQAYDGQALSLPAAMVTIHVTINPNHEPVALADVYALSGGTMLSVPAVSGVLENDSDVDGDELTAELTGLEGDSLDRLSRSPRADLARVRPADILALVNRLSELGVE